MSSNSNYNSFSTNTGNMTSNFFDSNTLVAKFAFLLVIVFGFIILLQFGISVVSYFLSPNQNPYLINGMIDARNETLVFNQDPSNNDAVTIYRSANQTDGLEFTWSVWIYVNSLNYLEDQYKHIFHKGNGNLAENGLNFPNNAPGLYLAPNSNKLVVIMNTFNVINEEIPIPNVPLNKWINVIMRCKNKTFDVYINGKIARSLQLTSVPKQNYGDVHVAMNGGFDGYVSNLRYFAYALGSGAIQNIANSGPNTTLVTGYGVPGRSTRNPDYLSLRWFFNNSYDMYNP
jgi:hypothetical protein